MLLLGKHLPKCGETPGCSKVKWPGAGGRGVPDPALTPDPSLVCGHRQPRAREAQETLGAHADTIRALCQVKHWGWLRPPTCSKGARGERDRCQGPACPGSPAPPLRPACLCGVDASRSVPSHPLLAAYQQAAWPRETSYPGFP